jgi:hypothetical protein
LFLGRLPGTGYVKCILLRYGPVCRIDGFSQHSFILPPTFLSLCRCFHLCNWNRSEFIRLSFDGVPLLTETIEVTTYVMILLLSLRIFVELSESPVPTASITCVPIPKLGNLWYLQVDEVSRDSSVGMATRYGLHSPGIKSRWGRDFLHQPPIEWVPGRSRG